MVKSHPAPHRPHEGVLFDSYFPLILSARICSHRFPPQLFLPDSAYTSVRVHPSKSIRTVSSSVPNSRTAAVFTAVLGRRPASHR